MMARRTSKAAQANSLVGSMDPISMSKEVNMKPATKPSTSLYQLNSTDTSFMRQCSRDSVKSELLAAAASMSHGYAAPTAHGHMAPTHGYMSPPLNGSVPPPKDVKPSQDVIYELQVGNRRYMNGALINQSDTTDFVDLLMDDPYNPVEVKAIVIACSHMDGSIETIFDAKAGELYPIRLMGNTCGANDGVVGSVNYALSMDPAPGTLLILGNSGSEIVAAAMRCVLQEKGVLRTDVPACRNKCHFISEKDIGMVKLLMAPCRDALMHTPDASFQKLCITAAKLNIWRTAENLLTENRNVAEYCANGWLQIHGAFLDSETGRVQMLGEHPSKAKLMQTLPPVDIVRTASSPAVPAEEALAMLIAGNQRFSARKGGAKSQANDFLRMQLSEGGQNPVAAILGCADSRAPIEILFDMRPGDLFVLRTAGNIITDSKGSLIGSAEYAVSHLRTKLIVVTGHSKCGAVTEAVKAVRAKADLQDVHGSIGNVLTNIVAAAKEAVSRLPDADVKEQVVEATKLNVFNAVERFIENSPLIKEGVANMDVQVHGAVYDIFSGKVEWLGQHPRQEEIVGKQMPMYRWKVKPYVRPSSPRFTRAAHQVIQKLRAGNERFVSGEARRRGARQVRAVPEPEVAVLCGTEFRVPEGRIFDCLPGEVVVQRCLGSIAGATSLALFASMEYIAVRFAPKVIVVLGESESEIMDEALAQLSGSDIPHPAMSFILDKVSPGAARALNQVESEEVSTSAGREMKARQLAVDFNVWNVIEALITNSPVIREVMRVSGLELHGAVLDVMTGAVEFLGQHPMVQELVNGSPCSTPASHD